MAFLGQCLFQSINPGNHPLRLQSLHAVHLRYGPHRKGDFLYPTLSHGELHRNIQRSRYSLYTPNNCSYQALLFQNFQNFFDLIWKQFLTRVWFMQENGGTAWMKKLYSGTACLALTRHFEVKQPQQRSTFLKGKILWDRTQSSYQLFFFPHYIPSLAGIISLRAKKCN